MVHPEINSSTVRRWIENLVSTKNREKNLKNITEKLFKYT